MKILRIVLLASSILPLHAEIKVSQKGHNQPYRLVLSQGDLASAKLEEQWQAFTQ